MDKSQSIGALATAVLKARTSFKPAIKDANNPFFKSKYLTLEGCYEAIDVAMAANGLVVIQSTDVGDHGPVLVSTLMHTSGEWISGSYPLKPVKDDPQGMGSAMTYARRYALMAMVGLAAEDDDGNAASRKVAKVASATGEVVTKIPKWSPEQLKEVGGYFAEVIRIGGETGEAEVKKLRADMKYDQPSSVIDAAAVLARKWLDIESQGNG